MPVTFIPPEEVNDLLPQFLRKWGRVCCLNFSGSGEGLAVNSCSGEDSSFYPQLRGEPFSGITVIFESNNIIVVSPGFPFFRDAAVSATDREISDDGSFSEKMNSEKLFYRALAGEVLSVDEALWLYEHAPGGELMAVADEIRRQKHPDEKVGWIIDRNINITNVCISGCRFCNFHCKKGDEAAFITSMDEYIPKIEELFSAGGRQILLQGGMHPQLGLDFYTSLFRELKSHFPLLKLHALGPPEVAFIARKERKPVRYILEELVKAGMESLPGAGAEILSDRVRKIISPGKCSTSEWLEVMREAHQMNLVTSATMMYGHIETLRERIIHLAQLRELQAEKPEGAYGFVTFIPWPFMAEGTRLQKEGVINSATPLDYLRLIAISRLMLTNIANIQASWLTVGAVTGQLALHSGANDFGSIMMEENVVSKAGARYSFDATGIQQAIRDAGFEPRYRNQAYEDEIPLVLE